MKRFLLFGSIFSFVLFFQNVEKIWGQDEVEKIKNDWMKKANRGLSSEIQSQIESFLNDMKNEVNLMTADMTDKIKLKTDLLKFREKYEVANSNIPMPEIDLKSASELQVAGIEKDKEGKTIVLTRLCAVKVNTADFLIAFYGEKRGCDSKLVSIYSKTAGIYNALMSVCSKRAGIYKKVYSRKAHCDCVGKVYVASLSDKGPYFFHFFDQTGATTDDEVLYPLVSEIWPSGIFSISVWHGGVFYVDVDGDGTKEIITGFQELEYPHDLEKLLGDYAYSVFPYRYTLYKWNKTKFDKLGEYFSFQRPPDE